MGDSSQPPPSSTLLAAAAGGFGGALLGVAAATFLMGDGDTSDSQAANEPQKTQEVELVAAER